MNETFNGFVTQPYFSKQYQNLYRFMPTTIQGIMIFMNEFDFSTTP